MCIASPAKSCNCCTDSTALATAAFISGWGDDDGLLGRKELKFKIGCSAGCSAKFKMGVALDPPKY